MIFLVDDNEELRAALEELVRTLGYDVRAFAVRWGVGGAVDVAEHTAFRREPTRPPAQYWRSSFYYRPWGFWRAGPGYGW